jgi:hypothetical protein
MLWGCQMSECKKEKFGLKVQKRIKAFELLSLKKITKKEAASRLKLSERQIRRISKRYQLHGISGLLSKKFGQISNNKIADDICNYFTDIVKNIYPDFGPTLAHEKLTELHEAKFSVETLRKWMITAKIWNPNIPPKKRLYNCRERRSCLGALVQVDGSIHPWLEDRSEKCVLLIAIDDATSRILAGQFVPVEDTENYLKMFKEYFNNNGIPESLYVDKHAVFKVNAKGCQDNTTQFQRIVKNLGINLIHANSPQAKGRVERAFKTLQDRLVKELRLAGINSVEEANKFLVDYWPKHNKKFAVKPSSNIDKHAPLTLCSEELDRVLALQYQRKVNNNYSISLFNNKFDLFTHNPMPYLRGSYVDILKLLNGDIIIQFQGQDISFQHADNEKFCTTTVDAKNINYILDTALQKRDDKKYCSEKEILNHVDVSIQQSFCFREHPVI